VKSSAICASPNPKLALMPGRKSEMTNVWPIVAEIVCRRPNASARGSRASTLMLTASGEAGQKLFQPFGHGLNGHRGEQQTQNTRGDVECRLAHPGRDHVRVRENEP
jgi:hypothetical protein